MKSATAYNRKDCWYVNASSQTTVGLWMGTPPFLSLPPNADSAAIGQATLLALDASRHAIPHPTKWDVSSPTLDLAGVKSWSAFMRGASCVNIQLDDALLTMTPNTNAGAKEGFSPLLDKEVRIPADSSAQQIGEAIRSAFSFCE